MTLSGEKLNSILVLFGIDVATEIRDNQEIVKNLKEYVKGEIKAMIESHGLKWDDPKYPYNALKTASGQEIKALQKILKEDKN